jgi:hypothetical protein
MKLGDYGVSLVAVIYNIVISEEMMLRPFTSDTRNIRLGVMQLKTC